MNKKILFKILIPSSVIALPLVTMISCGNNEYVNNKKYLLNLIDQTKNEFKDIINEIPKNAFDKNISTNYVMHQGHNKNGEYEIFYFKLKDLLHSEVKDLIILREFSSEINKIYKLDNDHKQIYSQVLDIKYEILYKKANFLFNFEWFVKNKLIVK